MAETKQIENRTEERPTAAVIKGAMDWIFNLAPESQPLSKGNFGTAAKIKRAYKGIVYACVSIIAKDVAATRWAFYRDGSDDPIDRADDAYQRLERPNPMQSWFDFAEMTLTYLELAGNAYWYVERSRAGVPTGNVWLIPPQYIKPIAKTTEIGVDYYRVTGLKGVRRFEVDEIVHLKYPSPSDMYVGMGTLDAALVEVDINTFAKDYTMNFYKNGAIPAGILSTDEKISQSDAQRIESVWNMKYQGSDQSWGVAVLWGGFKYQPLSLNPATEKFIEQSDWTRADIAAIFKVPLSKLGIVDDVNRANGETNDKTYWENCIDPKIRLLERKINAELLPKLQIDYRLRFESVVPEDISTKLEIEKANMQKAQIGGALGVLTVDELRELLGFEASGDDSVVTVDDVEKFAKALQAISTL